MKTDPVTLAKAVLAGKRVLIVEDNVLVCYGLEQTMREVGCDVVGPFCCLEDALSNTIGQQIDIAILDINLRGELVSPLAGKLRDSGVPFLLTSAYHTGELPEELMADVQLRKPITDSDLLVRLAAVCERH